MSFLGLFGRRPSQAYSSIAQDGEGGQISSMSSKPRKVPVKIEPKVYFANERTYLAWMHMSVTLASISVAITAFAEENDWSQLYGLILMPTSIAFCVCTHCCCTLREQTCCVPRIRDRMRSVSDPLSYAAFSPSP